MLESFRQEHTEIINILDKIDKLGVSSKEGHETLLMAKELILKHVEREDKNFYPKIKKAAKNNQMLEKLLIEFDKDMDQLSHYILNFFDVSSSCENKGTNLFTNKFVEVLKRRILREENILFPAFEKLQKNKYLGMKFDRRIADRRISELRSVPSQYEKIDSSEIENKRSIERRKDKRHPIHTWFIIYKKEFVFYLFVLIICIIAAVIGIFIVHSPDTKREFIEHTDYKRKQKKLNRGRTSVTENPKTETYYIQ